MPKHDAMAQISRPFQIVLVVFMVFACVWLFALQGHSTSTNGSASAPVVSATTPTSPPPVTKPAATKSAGAPKAPSSHIYHGPAPGVEGLTRDISRAHHAAAVSEGRTQRLEDKSAQVSGEAAPSASASSPTHTHTSAATAPVTKAATPASSKTPATSTVHKHASGSVSIPAGQRTVEAELAKGDVVLLLFWNPAGTDDVAMHRAVQQVRKTDRGARRRLAVQEAPASQVASYGSVTRGVQVYATPTLFVINKHGHAIVLTGVQDAFSIEQTIAEVAQSSP
jgi:hypothetical protein